MRIVIDLQGAQSESRYRGIGRYSLSLATFLTKHAKDHDIWLLLNGAFPETIIEIKAQFSEWLSPEKIRIFNVPLHVYESDTNNVQRTRMAEVIRESCISELNPDVLVLTSLFEGYLDNSVTSIKSSKTYKTVVVLYDLIPLLNPSTFLNKLSIKNHYLEKIKSLENADLLLAISNYSRQCAIQHLHIPENKVINISSATDCNFAKKIIDSHAIHETKAKYGINEKFIFCSVGGFDARKNVENLIKAYALLPQSIKKNHQLVMASKIDESRRRDLMNVCNQSRIHHNQIIFTGYIPNNDLVTLYNIAELFVFPSLCEGFGLPILEAMACGTPAIGSNHTSIPEVVGLESALFDGNSPESIANKIAEVILDETIRNKLALHAISQAAQFSWDKTSIKALQAIETLCLKSPNKQSLNALGSPLGHKKRLAFFSPFPPLATGIAGYSLELISSLSQYYEIDVISDQDDITPLPLSIRRHSVNWFKNNAERYDRILYQFGNSPYHSHMIDLLERYPGIVVLHDFYMSSMLLYEETYGNRPNLCSNSILQSHGYNALKERFESKEIDSIKNHYPCNLPIIQNAKGIIVHSDYSKQLAKHWYGESAANNWQVIPLLRVAAKNINREEARKKLGFNKTDFIVCSFGHMDMTKLNHLIIEAWVTSKLSKNSACHLIFVGAKHGGDYGTHIDTLIDHHNAINSIKITGWCSQENYIDYLQAADIAIQLRTMSRGETSAAALDCLNYGLATIVNANGAMSELPTNAAWKMPNDFQPLDLILALETLWQDADKRFFIAENARHLIHTKHHPNDCAALYKDFIESTYHSSLRDMRSLVTQLTTSHTNTYIESNLPEIAKSIASFSFKSPRFKQLLVDVTSIIKNDLKSGIERVVKAELLELIKHPPIGYEIQPVYLCQDNGHWYYRYARNYTTRILGIDSVDFVDQPIDVFPGDIFYGADYAPYEIIQASKQGLFTQWRALGIEINILVYDLLPILHPDFFPTGAGDVHLSWLKEIITFADRLIGISHAVANEIRHWLEINPSAANHPLKISAAPLGADISASAPTTGLPTNAHKMLSDFKKSTTFLTVGTIEPRKGYLQIIDAFDQLWADDRQVILVIIGKEGWAPLPNSERRTIPKIIHKIKNHPELGKRLFWINDASDEYLEKIYKSAICLIAASEGEGFGLPLIEAAKHGLPIIARDIPVFRELADDHAFYFSGSTKSELANAIKNWLDLFKYNSMPASTDIKWNTWKQHTEKLLGIILNTEHERVWAPLPIRKKALDEHLNLIHHARIKMVSTLLPKGSHILDLGGANCPLYKMGYPHHFEKLTLIDLPADKRHQYYKDIEVDAETTLGKVVLRYTDMTNLIDIENESVDFVWSGQSIEHVPAESGERMCHEVFRVLKKGGAFCLDTPNRHLTKIHTHPIGGGFIHPEHYIEYFPEQLEKILSRAGFTIQSALGICDMPESVATNEFHYSDFIFGKEFTPNINNGYIQYFHCVKE